MDFFHCNVCYIQPGQHTAKSFYLTNCGHSFCEDCINESDPICRVCRSNCKYLALNSDMPDSVKHYFVDGVKELKRMIKILLIQNQQCKIYMEEYVPKLEAKYLSAKLEIEKRRAEHESLRTTIQEKNAEIVSLHKMINKLKGEIEVMKKQFSRKPPPSATLGLLTPPNSHTGSCSPQSEMFTPKSGISVSSHHSRLSSQFQLNKDSYLSPASTASSSSFHKKSPTAMELLFRNKEQSRATPVQNTLLTPRNNQTFSMTINTSPESSEDERWTDPRSRPSQASLRSSITPNKMRGRFF